MLNSEDLNYILAVIALGSIAFSVWNKVRNPQINSERKDALLAQQVQWQIEGTEKRFKEMQDNFKELLLQSNNHIHTVDTKVESLQNIVVGLSTEVAKLSTIIEERIPKK